MNPITLKLVADKYIRLALEEDINSEDVSTNAVMAGIQEGGGLPFRQRGRASSPACRSLSGYSSS